MPSSKIQIPEINSVILIYRFKEKQTKLHHDKKKKAWLITNYPTAICYEISYHTNITKNLKIYKYMYHINDFGAFCSARSVWNLTQLWLHETLR